MMKNWVDSVESHFYCTQCGQEGIPIRRVRGQERKAGHLKILYCIHCGKTINHVEVKENSNYTYMDFKKEFESGVFNEEGLRNE